MKHCIQEILPRNVQTTPTEKVLLKLFKSLYAVHMYPKYATTNLGNAISELRKHSAEIRKYPPIVRNSIAEIKKCIC